MIKGKLIMMIATVVLLLAGLVSASLSWYTSQEQVSGENASVGAEESITASINSTLIEVSHYGGETGKAPSTHEDAPYSIDISLSLFASALEGTTHLKITLTSLIVGTGTIEETDKYIFETNTPEDDMTIRVLAGEDIYKMNNDGYLVLESNTSVFYEVQNGENIFTVTLYYLDEIRFLQWIQDEEDSLEEYNIESPAISYHEWLETQPEYFAYDACSYSNPIYMFTNFFLSMNYITEGASGE